jgi:hypothetical protein
VSDREANFAGGMAFDPDAEHRLRPQLRPGEELLWAGRPARGLKFYWVDVFLLPAFTFGSWIGFSNAWETFNDARQTPWTHLVTSTLFVITGAAGWGLWPLDAMNRAKTYYGITTERVVIVNEFIRRRVVSLSLKGAQWPRLLKHRDGTGTVTFRSVIADPPWINRGNVLPIERVFQHPTFVHIHDAAGVYELVRRLRHEKFGVV